MHYRNAHLLKQKLTSFDRNIIYSKNHFWFGNEPLSTEKLATYLKHEKASDVAHHVVSWASETGKGLLFYAKEGDKATPTGVIQLVCCQFSRVLRALLI